MRSEGAVKFVLSGPWAETAIYGWGTLNGHQDRASLRERSGRRWELSSI